MESLISAIGSFRHELNEEREIAKVQLNCAVPVVPQKNRSLEKQFIHPGQTNSPSLGQSRVHKGSYDMPTTRAGYQISTKTSVHISYIFSQETQNLFKS